MGQGHYSQQGIAAASTNASVPSSSFCKSRLVVELPSVICGTIKTATEADGIKYAVGKLAAMGEIFESVVVAPEGTLKFAKMKDGVPQARLGQPVPLEASTKLYRVYRIAALILSNLEHDTPREERKFTFLNGKVEGEHVAYFGYDMSLHVGYQHGHLKDLQAASSSPSANESSSAPAPLPPSRILTPAEALAVAAAADQAASDSAFEQTPQAAQPDLEAFDPPRAVFYLGDDADTLNGPMRAYFRWLRVESGGRVKVCEVDVPAARKAGAASLEADFANSLSQQQSSAQARIQARTSTAYDRLIVTVRLHNIPPALADEAYNFSEAITTDMRPVKASGIGGVWAGRLFLTANGNLALTHSLFQERAPSYPSRPGFLRAIVAYTAYIGLPSSPAAALLEKVDPETGLSTLSFGVYLSHAPGARPLLARVLDEERITGNGVGAQRVWLGAVSVGLVPQEGVHVRPLPGANAAQSAERQIRLGSAKPESPYGMPLFGELLTDQDFDFLRIDLDKYQHLTDDLPALAAQLTQIEDRRELLDGAQEHEEAIEMAEEAQAEQDDWSEDDLEAPRDKSVEAVQKLLQDTRDAADMRKADVIRLWNTIVTGIVRADPSAVSPPIEVEYEARANHPAEFYRMAVSSGGNFVLYLDTSGINFPELIRLLEHNSEVFQPFGLDHTEITHLADTIGDDSSRISTLATSIARLARYPILGSSYGRVKYMIAGGEFLLEENLVRYVAQQAHLSTYPLPKVVELASNCAAGSLPPSAGLGGGVDRRTTGFRAIEDARQRLPEAARAWLSQPHSAAALSTFEETAAAAHVIERPLLSWSRNLLLGTGFVDGAEWAQASGRPSIDVERAADALRWVHELEAGQPVLRETVHEQREQLGLSRAGKVGGRHPSIFKLFEEFLRTVRTTLDSAADGDDDDRESDERFFGGCAKEVIATNVGSVANGSVGLGSVWWQSFWLPEVTAAIRASELAKARSTAQDSRRSVIADQIVNFMQNLDSGEHLTAEEIQTASKQLELSEFDGSHHLRGRDLWDRIGKTINSLVGNGESTVEELLGGALWETEHGRSKQIRLVWYKNDDTPDTIPPRDKFTQKKKRLRLLQEENEPEAKRRTSGRLAAKSQ